MDESGKQEQPAHSENEPANIDLSPEQEEVVKQVERLYQKGKKGRERYDYKWIDWHKMFRGKQWSERRPSYRHSEVVNLVFQAIQSMVPIMTDSRPRITFMPQEPQDFPFADILNKVLESDWDKHKWMTKLAEVLFDAHIYGTGCSSLCFDPDGDYGLGLVKFRPEDPMSFYPDPSAKDVNEEGDWFVHASAEDVQKLKAKYPAYAKYIKADLVDFRYNQRNINGEDFFYSQINNMITKDFPSPTEQDKCLVLCCYLKPRDVEEVEEETTDEVTGAVKVEYVQKKKYPNGRKVIVVNKIPVVDEAIEYEDGNFPYSRVQNYLNPREFWGISEVEQLESPQKVFNKLISFALDTLTIMGNPIWIVPTSAGVDTSQLFNQPGLIVEPEGDGSGVRREEGVPLQPYVLQLIDRMEKWFNDVSGSQDVTRGINPTGVTANAAIENLQQAAQTRVRQKMRNLDDYLKDVGRQYVSRVLQYYTVPKVHRITGADGVTKYFKFHVEHGQDEYGNPQKTGIVTNYKQTDVGYSEHPESESYIINGEFDVKVDTQTALPFAKAEKEDRLFQYQQAGIIDSEELLKQVDYPNYQAVLDRMKKNQAAQQAQQPQKG